MPCSGCKSSHGSHCSQEVSNLLSLTIETLSGITSARLCSLGACLSSWHLVLLLCRLPAVRSLHKQDCFLNCQVRNHWFPKQWLAHGYSRKELDRLLDLSNLFSWSPFTPIARMLTLPCPSKMPLSLSSANPLSRTTTTVHADACTTFSPASPPPLMPLWVNSPNCSWRNIFKTQIISNHFSLC